MVVLTIFQGIAKWINHFSSSMPESSLGLHQWRIGFAESNQSFLYHDIYSNNTQYNHYCLFVLALTDFHIYAHEFLNPLQVGITKIARQKKLRTKVTLLWRHNGPDSVSNHQPHDCLRVTGLCAGNSPWTGEFPAQMASNVGKWFHLMTPSCLQLSKYEPRCRRWVVNLRHQIPHGKFIWIIAVSYIHNWTTL